LKQVYKLYGDRIRDMRNKKLLTQVELAERAGISAQHISEIERESKRRGVHANTLRKIASVLDVQPEFLIRRAH
jgi:transcriptional regulator with XRE-family HTH domain